MSQIWILCKTMQSPGQVLQDKDKHETQIQMSETKYICS